MMMRCGSGARAGVIVRGHSRVDDECWSGKIRDFPPLAFKRVRDPKRECGHSIFNGRIGIPGYVLQSI